MKSNSILFNNETIQYDGRLGELSKIWFKNLFLSILTLGIYRFWGKTKLRQYLVSCHSLSGERFVFTGKPEELFYGFFRAISYLLPILIVLFINIIYDIQLAILIYLYVIFLSKYFAYGSLQYLNVRTKWKGIHGSLKGSKAKFARGQFFSYLLTIITCGLFSPYIAIERQEYIMKHYTFGGMNGTFNRVQHKLFSRNLYSCILAFPTLGYSRAWYTRLLNEYLYNNSTIGDVQLKYTATTGQIFKFTVQCLLLHILTFGLATPVVLHKKNQFNSKYISFSGAVDIDQLTQHRASVDAALDDGASLISDDFDIALA